MNQKRQRARASMWLGLLVLLTLGASAASPAGAQDLQLYQEPGRHPYTGDEATALQRLGQASRTTSLFPSVTDGQLEKGLAAYEADNGCSVYYLKDGDVIIVMSTIESVHYAFVMRIKFIDPETGGPLSPYHEDRRVVHCPMGRSDNVQFGRLDACGNWALVSLGGEVGSQDMGPAIPMVQIEPPARYAPALVLPDLCPDPFGRDALFLQGVPFGGPVRESPVLQSEPLLIPQWP